jgi:hypothetical protein
VAENVRFREALTLSGIHVFSKIADNFMTSGNAVLRFEKADICGLKYYFLKTLPINN